MSNYDASNIQILEGLEAVRKRPGMYIGSTGARGLHHLVWEIIDNAIDEALGGYATNIKLELLPDDVIKVTDDGRGIPVDLHPKTNRPAVETILTSLHSGGKFDGKSYKVSGGLHGVGASVVNALSEWFLVEIHRNDKVYLQRYERGVPMTDVEEVGSSVHTGTIITFKSDHLVFTETNVYDYEILRSRVQQLAFLNRGIKITIIDARTEQHTENEYHYEGGIVEYVGFLNKGKGKVNQDIIYTEKETDGVTLEIAMQYNDSYATNLYSFANNIPTHEGGMHEDGFKLALSRVINKYATENNLLKKDDNLIGEDTREGLTAVISVKHPDPQFEGQTKTKLGNPEVRQISSQIVGEGLERYLIENPQDAKAIVEKCLLASRARLAAKKQEKQLEENHH